MSTTLRDVLDLACGDPRAAGSAGGPARRTQLAIASTLGALVLAAIWGVAAGSASLRLAAADALKAPLVVLLSALCAIPAALLTARLGRATYGARELLLGFASAIFGGTLVLAVLAPLVAIFYHTSARTGLGLAIGSVFVALIVAAVLFVRNLRALAPAAVRARDYLPVVVAVGLHALSLLQFIGLASPFFPGGTIFDRGIDGLLR